MRQVTFAMVFSGGGSEEIGPDHVRVWSSAPSAALRTSVDDGGTGWELVPGDGQDAIFHSEVRWMSGTAFDEWGTIELGAGNVIHFQTIGEGYLAPAAKDGVQHGTVMWEVTNGEGALRGATGLITSNFVVEDGAVTDYQFGVLWCP